MKKRNQWLFMYTIIIFVFFAVLYGGNRAVTVISENIPPNRDLCIIIDAGHGGIDGGATSCTGKLESGFNLEISVRLNDLFHLLGYKTRMIRTADTSVYTKGTTIAQQKVSDLKERVRIVRETEHALLISIHQNNFSQEKYSGAQVFYGAGEGSEALAKSLQTAFVSSVNPGSKRQSNAAFFPTPRKKQNCPPRITKRGYAVSSPQLSVLICRTLDRIGIG